MYYTHNTRFNTMGYKIMNFFFFNCKLLTQHMNTNIWHNIF